jgi:hypothetical protein
MAIYIQGIYIHGHFTYTHIAFASDYLQFVNYLLCLRAIRAGLKYIFKRSAVLPKISGLSVRGRPTEVTGREDAFFGTLLK